MIGFLLPAVDASQLQNYETVPLISSGPYCPKKKYDPILGCIPKAFPNWIAKQECPEDMIDGGSDCVFPKPRQPQPTPPKWVRSFLTTEFTVA
jgi:hypothetical protein